MSKQFFMFQVHFHSILKCQTETLTQTCWVTDDRLLFKVSGILTLIIPLWWNQLLTFHQNLSWAVNFFKRLVMISVWKLSVGVPLSNQYLFVNISRWSNIQCASSRFKVYWRWWSPQFFIAWKKSIHGIRNQLILRRLWNTFYTILLNIFLLVWSSCNWMLSLEYWKLGHISSTITTL